MGGERLERAFEVVWGEPASCSTTGWRFCMDMLAVMEKKSCGNGIASLALAPKQCSLARVKSYVSETDGRHALLATLT